MGLDAQDQGSVDAAVANVLAEESRIDVLVHASHMAFSLAEAVTPEQFQRLYDVNAHRLHRAALPYLRMGGGEPLVVWVGSTSTRGGTPFCLAVETMVNSLAISRVARWAAGMWTR